MFHNCRRILLWQSPIATVVLVGVTIYDLLMGSYICPVVDEFIYFFASLLTCLEMRVRCCLPPTWTWDRYYDALICGYADDILFPTPSHHPDYAILSEVTTSTPHTCEIHSCDGFNNE
jgi:hypothetical protein